MPQNEETPKEEVKEYDTEIPKELQEEDTRTSEEKYIDDYDEVDIEW